MHLETLPLTKITPSRANGRKMFCPHALQRLADSIESVGLLQPLLVTPQADGYTILAGERRYRALCHLQRTHAPCVVYDQTAEKKPLANLIENFQREPLNPMEIAESLANLLCRFNLNQTTLSRQLGMKRSTLTNYLRLRKLPKEIQDAVRNATITLGHAKTLLGYRTPQEQLRAFAQWTRRPTSVRTLEHSVKPSTHQEVEQTLASHLLLQTHIRKKKHGYELVLHLPDQTSLEQLIEQLLTLA